MNLYFENSRGQRRLIAHPNTSSESWLAISKFCAERNFEVYYVRKWVTPDGERYYDVGSHTEFFVETDINDETVTQGEQDNGDN